MVTEYKGYTISIKSELLGTSFSNEVYINGEFLDYCPTYEIGIEKAKRQIDNILLNQ